MVTLFSTHQSSNPGSAMGSFNEEMFPFYVHILSCGFRTSTLHSPDHTLVKTPSSVHDPMWSI
jgi:hypothetical protein